MPITVDETSNKPADVVRRALKFFEERNIKGFVDLFSADAKVEVPLQAPGVPNSLNGREEVRAYLANYTDKFHVNEIPELFIHETADPEVVIVEWTAHGTTVATGKPYEMKYIIVIRVRNGEMVGYRDYFSPIQAAKAGHTRPEIRALYPDES